MSPRKSIKTLYDREEYLGKSDLYTEFPPLAEFSDIAEFCNGVTIFHHSGIFYHW